MRWEWTVALALACSPTSFGTPRDVGPDAESDGAPLRDSASDGLVDARGADSSTVDGGSDLDDGGAVMSEGRAEVCGNGVDDDGNDRVDDGCECTVGTVRACWLGPLAKRGVGSCQDGQQACEPEGAVANWGYCVDQQLPGLEYLGNGSDDDCDGIVDEAGGLCVSTGNNEVGACTNGRDDDCDTRVDCDDPDCATDPNCTSPCQATEQLCWGGYDDDCDGQVDCEDADCRSDTSCLTPGCSGGQVYTQRDLGTRRGSSGIEAGDGEPVMEVSCGGSRCGSGQVEVRIGATSLCVPPPSACPAGQYPTYSNATSGWRCEPPCEVIIQYGYIYGFQRRCAPRPPATCPTGQVQTYREDLERWICNPTCDNTLYDRVWLDGQLVCVPC